MSQLIGPLSLRMDTAPGTGLGLDESAVDRYMELAGKGLIVPPGCNSPAVQDDFALDPSRSVEL
ncbi:hypothetical protein FHR32_006323 [Streptosporangium album]|uniref:Uncharacterized protein n=1 Tax=Streptosporangium album TaxID=47479 RepID=A0A7W7WBU8_9ACTN|nr:hypothetical protein [Streptosporangium album]MBB4941937.1 hypothetical protein [Streptosporangium album]